MSFISYNQSIISILTYDIHMYIYNTYNIYIEREKERMCKNYAIYDT